MTLNPNPKSKTKSIIQPKPIKKTKLTNENYTKLRKLTGGGFVRTYKQ